MARIVKAKPPKADLPKDPKPSRPASESTLGAPTGIIGGPLKIAYGRGGQWSTVNQYDPHFLVAGKKHNVAPAMLKAMAVIESGGQMIANQGGSGAYGIMQFKISLWAPRAAVLGYNLTTPAGQIGMAAAILGGDVPGVKGDTPEERFLSTYYPTPCLDCAGEDGHTPRMYLADMHELMRQIDAAASGTTPAPRPRPVEDPIRVIVGGDYPPIDYGFGSDVGLDYYAYGVGHGTTRRTQHTGYDVGVPLGTKLFSPINGVVDCVGGRGTPRWGQSCGAYADTITGGVGNITLYGDSGHKLTLGHCNTALVAPGERVKAGQQVGTSGGMNGPHVHVEVSVERNGTYWLLDPGPALREVMGGEPVVVYADPIDVPQPAEFDQWWTATAARDGVKVYQRADPHSPESYRPLRKGEEVEIVYLVIGADTALWAITRNRRRIPASGLDLSAIPGLEGDA
jgi:murein DD-endopeptidase MepM/ murein hydrolase activator NlpD